MWLREPTTRGCFKKKKSAIPSVVPEAVCTQTLLLPGARKGTSVVGLGLQNRLGLIVRVGTFH